MSQEKLPSSVVDGESRSGPYPELEESGPTNSLTRPYASDCSDNVVDLRFKAQPSVCQTGRTEGDKKQAASVLKVK